MGFSPYLNPVSAICHEIKVPKRDFPIVFGYPSQIYIFWGYLKEACRNISITFAHSAEMPWMPDHGQGTWWVPAGQHIRKCYFHSWFAAEANVSAREQGDNNSVRGALSIPATWLFQVLVMFTLLLVISDFFMGATIQQNFREATDMAFSQYIQPMLPMY